MIGAFVILRYGSNFDRQAFAEIAKSSRSRFERMPGLRSKAFTLNPERREVVNFYVWDSEAAARAFFTKDLLDLIEGLYGVRPVVEFVEIAELVDNAQV